MCCAPVDWQQQTTCQPNTTCVNVLDDCVWQPAGIHLMNIRIFYYIKFVASRVMPLLLLERCQSHSFFTLSVHACMVRHILNTISYKPFVGISANL